MGKNGAWAAIADKWNLQFNTIKARPVKRRAFAIPQEKGGRFWAAQMYMQAGTATLEHRLLKGH